MLCGAKEDGGACGMGGVCCGVLLYSSCSGWLSKNRDENPRMHALLVGILNWKFCTCADSRHNFWTANLKTALQQHCERLYAQFLISNAACQDFGNYMY